MPEDRKARLAALAQKAGRQPVAKDSGDDQDAAEDAKPALKFRNYVPKDGSLEPAAAPARDADSGGGRPPPKRRKGAEGAGGDTSAPPKSALELALARTDRRAREAAGQDVGAGGWDKMTPMPELAKKVNWDLKRDIQHKMDKLERRTQRSIVELLRERLAREAAEGRGGDEDSDLD